MKRFTTILLLLFVLADISAQNFISENFQGSWSTRADELYRNMNICNGYTFQVREHGKGRLNITVNFQNEEADDAPLVYSIFLPITVTVLEQEENSTSNTIQVEYGEINFMFEDQPSFRNLIIPPAYQNYFDYLESLYSNQTKEYQFIIINDNRIRLEFEDDRGKEILWDLQQFGRIPTCDQFKRS